MSRPDFHFLKLVLLTLFIMFLSFPFWGFPVLAFFCLSFLLRFLGLLLLSLVDFVELASVMA
jgi:hypothetical protein